MSKKASALPTISEAEFQRQVVELAKLRGFKVYHTYNAQRSEAGLPDLLLVRERVLWAELKRESGKVSSEQLEWIHALIAALQEVYVWRPSDWPQIQEVLA